MKIFYDRLGQLIQDGDLFLFIDKDNEVKMGFTTLIPGIDIWFSEVFSYEYRMYHKDREWYELSKPYNNLCTFRETRNFEDINTSSVIIIRKFEAKKKSYYGKWW